MISCIELRAEDSPEVKKYTHTRSIEKLVIKLGPEITELKEKFYKVGFVWFLSPVDLVE